MLTHFELINENGLEFLRDTETGLVWVTFPVMRQALGWERDSREKIKSRSLTDFINFLGIQIEVISIKSTDLSGRLNHLKAVSPTSFDAICAWSYAKKNNHRIYPILSKQAKDFISAYQHHQSLLTSPNKARLNNDESRIRDRIARQENGQTEVSCPVGRVDVLTSLEVIEVKAVKGWKSALGQVLAYKYYFPGRTPRIHLYMGATQEMKQMIESIVQPYGVRVTWEKTKH